MKRFVGTITLLLIICIHVHAQEDLFYKGSQIKVVGTANDAVAISQNPITNREYIIYLMWMKNVFEPTFPDLFYTSIPGLNIDSLRNALLQDLANRDFKTILDYSQPFVRDYMFNPKYLDYPVVGVSWQNANNFGKWLADRYNENYLIENKFLNHIAMPTDQDYFSTDAYLAGRWQGQLRMKLPSNNPEYPERDFEWADGVFIPAFRLPIKSEATGTIKNDANYFKACPFSKKHFLSRWNKQFISAQNDTSYLLSQSFIGEPFPGERISCNKTMQMDLKGELYLDLNNSTNKKDLLEIYEQNGQEQIEDYLNNANFGNNYWELGSTGSAFPYVIIQEGKDKKPVYVSAYKKLEPADYKEFKVFRLACSATQKQLGIKTKK